MISFDAAGYQRQLRDLAEGYQELPRTLQRRFIKSAIRKAVKETNLESSFKSAAPKLSGNLKKSVTIVTGFLRSGVGKGQPYARVGYGRSKSKKGYHAIIVNDGTKDRYTKTGAYRGRGPATGFANGVLRQAQTTGLIALERHLTESLEAAKRYLPRYLAGRGR
jgi:hypothetical protein